MSKNVDDISTSPLPEDFYQSKGWHETMVDFYCRQKAMLPDEVLSQALKKLSKDLENIMILEANLPDMAYGFLTQVIDPLFDPQEYREKIYQTLRQTADENKDERYIILAVSLLNIRCFFECNKEFLNESFSQDIQKIESGSPEEKVIRFGETMQAITRAHVKQIADMLVERE